MTALQASYRPWLGRLSWPGWLLPTAGVLILASIVSLPPVLYIVVNAFNTAPPGEPFTFGLEGWVTAFANKKTLASIAYSFLLNIRSVVGIAVAFLLAWLLVRARIPFRGFIELSLWVAFFLPALPLAISWVLLTDPQFGLLNRLLAGTGIRLNPYSAYGIVWVHLTSSTIPIMTILLAPALRQMEASLEEAARACGAGPWRCFVYIVIPVLAPTLLVVWLVGLIRGLESFQIELFLGRPAGIEVFATRIYDLISWDPPQFDQAMILSNFFLGTLFVLALFYHRFTAKRQYATISGRGASFRQIDIGVARYVLGAAVVAFVLVAIYLPIGMLLLGSCMTLFGYFDIATPFTLQHWSAVLGDPVFLSSTLNSLVLGLSSAVFGLIIYCFFGYMLVRTSIRGKAFCNTVLWLPWTVPGILMGFGFLWIFLSVPFFSKLYGTFLPLIWIIIVKEVPIGAHLVRTSFTQISQELEQAARVCGAGRIRTLIRVTLPLASPMLIAIFTIVFIAAVRDVDSIILLAGSSTRPLSLLMMEYALNGQMEAASIISFILAVLGLVVAVVARRRYSLGG